MKVKGTDRGNTRKKLFMNLFRSDCFMLCSCRFHD